MKEGLHLSRGEYALREWAGRVMVFRSERDDKPRGRSESEAVRGGEVRG